MTDLIPIAEYAARVGRAVSSVRQKCQRGTLPEPSSWGVTGSSHRTPLTRTSESAPENTWVPAVLIPMLPILIPPIDPKQKTASAPPPTV